MSSRLSNDGSLGRKSLSGLQTIKADTITASEVSGVSTIACDTITVDSTTTKNLDVQSGARFYGGLTGTSIYCSSLSSSSGYIANLTGSTVYASCYGPTGVFNNLLSSSATVSSLSVGSVTGTSVYASCYGPTGLFNNLSSSSASVSSLSVGCLTGTSVYASCYGPTGLFNNLSSTIASISNLSVAGMTGTTVYASCFGSTGVFNTITSADATINNASIGSLTGTTIYAGNVRFSSSVVGPTGVFNTVNSSNGVISNIIYQSATGSSTHYTANLMFTNTLGGPTGYFTNLSVSANVVHNWLTIKPNIKGSGTRSNVTTYGTEIQDATILNEVFAGDTTDYAFSATSSQVSNPARYMWGTTGTQFWMTVGGYNATTGNYSSGGATWVDTNNTSYSAHYCRVNFKAGFVMRVKSIFVRLPKPSGFSAAKQLYCFGYYRINNLYKWKLLGSYTNPSNNASSVTFTDDGTWSYCDFWYLLFAITSCYTIDGVIVPNASLQGGYVTGTYSRIPNQSVYIPQSLEVGRPDTINTTMSIYPLKVGGDCYVERYLFH